MENTMSNAVIHVTDSDFSKIVLQSESPILVDYWAEWCGPCKQIAPILDEIAEEYTDRITVAKINIDDNPQTPQNYGVRGIPTLMLFKNGEIEATKVGALTKGQLASFLDTNL
jgi:thioredoxin 1